MQLSLSSEFSRSCKQFSNINSVIISSKHWSHISHWPQQRFVKGFIWAAQTRHLCAHYGDSTGVIIVTQHAEKTQPFIAFGTSTRQRSVYEISRLATGLPWVEHRAYNVPNLLKTLSHMLKLNGRISSKLSMLNRVIAECVENSNGVAPTQTGTYGASAIMVQYADLFTSDILEWACMQTRPGYSRYTLASDTTLLTQV